MRVFSMIFVFSLSVGIGAQTVLKDIQFIPPTFFVGDLVELRITLDSDDLSSINTPSVLPQADWIDIRNIVVEKEGSEILILLSFTPFAAGTRSLPAMNLGAFELKDIRIPTHTMLPAMHKDLRRLRGQLVLPGTRLALALILGLIAMAPFLIYGFLRLLWNCFCRSRKLFRIRRPVRRFRRTLRKLQMEVGSESASPWFSELTDGLRIYLSEKTGYDCNTATTAEIAEIDVFGESSTPQKRLLEVLKNADMVKFAGHSADNSSLERTLGIVESAVIEWEKVHVQL